MFAPSPLNEVDDGIPVGLSRRGRGGTSPLIRFRLLGTGHLFCPTILILGGVGEIPVGSSPPFGTMIDCLPS